MCRSRHPSARTFSGSHPLCGGVGGAGAAMPPPTRYSSITGSIPPTEIVVGGSGRHFLGNIDHALWPDWLREHQVPSQTVVASALAPYMCHMRRHGDEPMPGSLCCCLGPRACFFALASLAGVIHLWHTPSVCNDFSQTSSAIFHTRVQGPIACLRGSDTAMCIGYCYLDCCTSASRESRSQAQKALRPSKIAKRSTR